MVWWIIIAVIMASAVISVVNRRRAYLRTQRLVEREARRAEEVRAWDEHMRELQRR